MNPLKISLTIQLPWMDGPITWNREVPGCENTESMKFLNEKTKRVLLGNLVIEFLLIIAREAIARIQEDQSREG